MISDKNFYTVYGWMRKVLHLSGADLLVFALIYSFCQGWEGVFSGSLSYICEWTGLSRSSARRSLCRLVEAGRIQKRAGESVNSYVILPIDGIEERTKRGVNLNHLPVQNEHTPGFKMNPNINNNINNKLTKERKKENKNISASSRAREDEFINMTDEELVSWGERGFQDFDDSDFALLPAYSDECKRRAKRPWDGKIVKGESALERLKSHEEILEENGITGLLKSKYLSFLKSSYLNGRLIPNDKLEDIIFRLNERFDPDTEGTLSKIQTLDRAINGGYFDVR